MCSRKAMIAMIASHQAMTISNVPPINWPKSSVETALGTMAVLVTPVRTTENPSVSPITHSQREGYPNRLWCAAMTRGDCHASRRGGDDCADGQVQLARDHEKPDGQRDDANFGGDVEPAREARERNERVARDNREEDEDRNHSEEGPSFGTPEEPSQRGN